MGNATITNSKIYAKSNKNCIVSDEFEDNSQTLTINGKTLISNVEDTTNSSGVISWKSPGQITINKDVTIDGMVGLNIYPNKEGHSANVNITGATISTKQAAISIKGGDGTLKLQNAKVIAGSNALNCEGNSSVEVYDSSLTVKNGSMNKCTKVMDNSGLVLVRSTLSTPNQTALYVESPSPVRVIDSKLYSPSLPLEIVGNSCSVSVEGSSFLGGYGSTWGHNIPVPDGSSLTVSGDSILSCGLLANGHVEFTGNSSIYAYNASISVKGSGTLYVDTTGTLARNSQPLILLQSTSQSAPVTLAKGHFATPGDTLNGLGAYVTGTPQTTHTEPVVFPVCTAPGSIKNQNVTLNVVEVTAQ